MASIKRSGSSWQALIRKKKISRPNIQTFSSRAGEKLWANAVESSLETPSKLDLKLPQSFLEANNPPYQSKTSRSAEHPDLAIPFETFVLKYI